MPTPHERAKTTAQLGDRHVTHTAKDNLAGIMTSTGITATIPAMVTLVEAVAGRTKAAEVAGELGLDQWDARHRTADFALTAEHRKTFVRNLLTFWRHERIGVPVADGVDEIALGLTVDAYARTGLVDLVTLGADDAPVRSKHSLVIHPAASVAAGQAIDALPPPRSERPALAVDRALEHIAAMLDRPTAELVALIMEYRWSAAPTVRAR